jgi:hypothetical protein
MTEFVQRRSVGNPSPSSTAGVTFIYRSRVQSIPEGAHSRSCLHGEQRCYLQRLLVFDGTFNRSLRADDIKYCCRDIACAQNAASSVGCQLQQQPHTIYMPCRSVTYRLKLPSRRVFLCYTKADDVHDGTRIVTGLYHSDLVRITNVRITYTGRRASACWEYTGNSRNNGNLAATCCLSNAF